MAEKKTASLPSVQQLFHESWELFQKTIFAYLKLVGLGIAFVLLGALLGILISLPITFIAYGSHFQIFHHLTPFHIANLVLLVLWAILYIVSIIAMSIIFPIVSIFILQRKEKASIVDLIKKSKHFFLPFFLVTLLSGLLTLGGMILLVVPGLIIEVLLIFFSYEVVIEKQFGMSALRRSYVMVKNHFWEVVVRVLLLDIAIWIVSSVMGQIAGVDVLLKLAQLVLTLFLVWYARSYTFLLYKQVRAKTTFPSHVSLRWIWIVSGVGWLIIILLLIALGVGAMHLPGMQLTNPPRYSNAA